VGGASSYHANAFLIFSSWFICTIQSKNHAAQHIFSWCGKCFSAFQTTAFPALIY